MNIEWTIMEISDIKATKKRYYAITVYQCRALSGMMVCFINYFFALGKIFHNYSYNIYKSLSDISVYLFKVYADCAINLFVTRQSMISSIIRAGAH